MNNERKSLLEGTGQDKNITGPVPDKDADKELPFQSNTFPRQSGRHQRNENPRIKARKVMEVYTENPQHHHQHQHVSGPCVPLSGPIRVAVNAQGIPVNAQGVPLNGHPVPVTVHHHVPANMQHLKCTCKPSNVQTQYHIVSRSKKVPNKGGSMTPLLANKGVSSPQSGRRSRSSTRGKQRIVRNQTKKSTKVYLGCCFRAHGSPEPEFWEDVVFVTPQNTPKSVRAGKSQTLPQKGSSMVGNNSSAMKRHTLECTNRTPTSPNTVRFVLEPEVRIGSESPEVQIRGMQRGPDKSQIAAIPPNQSVRVSGDGGSPTVPPNTHSENNVQYTTPVFMQTKSERIGDVIHTTVLTEDSVQYATPMFVQAQTTQPAVSEENASADRKLVASVAGSQKGENSESLKPCVCSSPMISNTTYTFICTIGSCVHTTTGGVQAPSSGGQGCVTSASARAPTCQAMLCISTSQDSIDKSLDVDETLNIDDLPPPPAELLADTPDTSMEFDSPAVDTKQTNAHIEQQPKQTDAESPLKQAAVNGNRAQNMQTIVEDDSPRGNSDNSPKLSSQAQTETAAFLAMSYAESVSQQSGAEQACQQNVPEKSASNDKSSQKCQIGANTAALNEARFSSAAEISAKTSPVPPLGAKADTCVAKLAAQQICNKQVQPVRPSSGKTVTFANASIQNQHNNGGKSSNGVISANQRQSNSHIICPTTVKQSPTQKVRPFTHTPTCNTVVTSVHTSPRTVPTSVNPNGVTTPHQHNPPCATPYTQALQQQRGSSANGGGNPQKQSPKCVITPTRVAPRPTQEIIDSYAKMQAPVANVNVSSMAGRESTNDVPLDTDIMGTPLPPPESEGGKPSVDNIVLVKRLSSSNTPKLFRRTNESLNVAKRRSAVIKGEERKRLTKSSESVEDVMIDLDIAYEFVRQKNFRSSFIGDVPPDKDRQVVYEDHSFSDVQTLLKHSKEGENVYALPQGKPASFGEDTMEAVKRITDKYNTPQRWALQAKSFESSLQRPNPPLSAVPNMEHIDLDLDVDNLPPPPPELLNPTPEGGDPQIPSLRERARLNLFYRAHAAEICICDCLADLLIPRPVDKKQKSKNQKKEQGGEWQKKFTGRPLFVFNTGAGRRRRQLQLVLADSSTAFPLWSDYINYLSEFRPVAGANSAMVTHMLHQSTNLRHLVAIRYHGNQAATDFYNKFLAITADPSDALWRVSGDKGGYKSGTKNRNSKRLTPEKIAISHPCHFAHVTHVDKTDTKNVPEKEVLERYVARPRSRSLSEDALIGESQ